MVIHPQSVERVFVDYCTSCKLVWSKLKAEALVLFCSSIVIFSFSVVTHVAWKGKSKDIIPAVNDVGGSVVIWTWAAV